MLWLKRNLLLVVGGLVTLVLLGFGGYYVFASINKNKQVEEQLQQAQSELESLYRLDPFPQATNIAKARQEKEKVIAALRQTQKHFTPIPVEKVSDPRDFSILLENTLSELRRKAEQSGVLLPEKDKNYAFTFKEHQKRVKFAQGSFPALPELLADIKVICGILFETRFNQLLNLRRVRVSVDDVPGQDFTELKIETHPGTGAIMVPFEVQIACFSSQLATLLETLGKSPYGFVVQVLTAEPLSGQSPEVKPPPPKAGPAPGTAPVVGARQPGVAAPAAAPADNPVVLIEQTLKVDLLIMVVKPK
jgi:hypothetical protein